MKEFDSDRYPHVFTPLRVGNLTLKNRIQFPPTVCNMVSVNGEVTQEFVDYVDTQASTGAGLVTLGATPIDFENAVDFAGELNVTSDDMITGLLRLSEVAHIYDAKLSVELVHAGRGADPALMKADYAIAPSNAPIPGKCEVIKEMDRADMDKVIYEYADAAKRLVKAQFDMAMIHAAHGNLLAQFLSPVSNFRTDLYGGSLENRMRFPLEVLRGVRDAVGDRLALEMRISGDEIMDGGMHIEEVIDFIKVAQEYIDLVHISAGIIVDPVATFNTMPPYYKPLGCNVPYAKAVKECGEITIPVATVGGIVTLSQAEEILGEGSADIVAMARALMADPDLLKKSYRGDEDLVRPCLRCWGCGEILGAHTRCAVNPALGRSEKYRDVRPSFVRKKVVVIGAGPAGMTAARTLCERGHSVVLFEEEKELGGMLRSIVGPPFKDDLRKYLKWSVAATKMSGAELRLGAKATRDSVMSEEPDVIFVATGSTEYKPPIPGIDSSHVISVVEVDSMRSLPPGNVVVCGGGISGCECALFLAMEGRAVRVVDMLAEKDFARGMADITRNMLMVLLKEYNVSLIGSSRVALVTDGGIETVDADGITDFIPADSVVSAFGTASDVSGREAFSGLVPETYIVGDCRNVGNIKRANMDAYNLAVQV
jgi:2,4-dienoyl-CoA reductase-like NADH-dependent reductase (Old Yellow Enzyme family)/thioredoxin reductase